MRAAGIPFAPVCTSAFSRPSLSSPLPAAAALDSGLEFGSNVWMGTRPLAASCWTMPFTFAWACWETGAPSTDADAMAGVRTCGRAGGGGNYEESVVE